MTTPVLKEQEALQEIVRKGIDMQLNGAISSAEAKRYWLGHLPNLPAETVAEVLAQHLPTIQGIEHALMKKLLSNSKTQL